MTYQEDFVLEKKYLNLLQKRIYSSELNLFGMITKIEITDHGIYLKAYFSKLHNSEMIFFEDFKNGKIKFVIITDVGISNKFEKQLNDENLQSIKDFLEEEFSQDKIVYQTNDEHQKENEREKDMEVCKIGNTFPDLKKLSAEIFYDNYTTLELYKKYSLGAITETELLYGVCNYLCEEIKRLKDDNLNYFIDKFNHEQEQFLVEYAARKKEVDKKGKKIIHDKEEMFEMLDVLIGTEENE